MPAGFDSRAHRKKLNDNGKKAAEVLGTSPTTVYRCCRRLNIELRRGGPKGPLRNRMIEMLAGMGYNAAEIGKRTGYTRQWAHDYIKRTGLKEQWEEAKAARKKKLEKANAAEKEELRKEKEREWNRWIDEVKKANLNHQNPSCRAAFACIYAKKHMHFMLHDYLSLFDKYFEAKEKGETPTLIELSKDLKMHASTAGRCLEYAGLKPFNKRGFPAKRSLSK